MDKEYNDILESIENFKENHQKNSDGNKAAGLRARKVATELKKLLTEYRKSSIESNN
mgnify:CR=1 FL=1